MSQPLNLAKGQRSSAKTNSLYIFGGVVLVAAGAGLLLSRPAIRRKLREIPVGELLAPIFPDIARYVKMQAM